METEEPANKGPVPSRFVLRAKIVNQKLSCPICLQIIKDAYCVRECMHRFCLKCIEMALRVGKKQCPSCRAKCPSKRSCRKDKPFDDLIRAIYPNLGAMEKSQEEIMRANLAGMRAFQEAAKKGRRRQQELLLKYKKPRLRKAERSPRTDINGRQQTPRPPTQPCQSSPPLEKLRRKRRKPNSEPDSKASESQVVKTPPARRSLEPHGHPLGLTTPSKRKRQAVRAPNTRGNGHDSVSARLSFSPQEKKPKQQVPRVTLREKQYYVGFYTMGHNDWEGWLELEESSTFFLEQQWCSNIGYMIETKTFRGTWKPLAVGGVRIECSSQSSSGAPTLANEMLLNPLYPDIYVDSQTSSFCMKRVPDNYVSHLRTRKHNCLNLERHQANLQKKEIAFFLRRKNTCPHGELEKDNLITGLNASIKHLCRYLSQHVVIDPARCKSLPHNKLEAKNFQIFIGTRIKLENGKFKDIERKITDPLPSYFTLSQTIKLWNSEAELDLEWQVVGI